MTPEMTITNESPEILAGLAAEINAEHAAVQRVVRAGLGHAMRAGGLLVQVKESLPHGEFEAWLEQNCPFSIRTARAYMRVFRRLPKTATVADLSFREAIKLVAAPKDSVAPEQPETLGDALSFIPLPGMMLIGTDRNRELMVVPSTLKGYCYVIRVDNEPTGGIVEGCQRPIREDAIPIALGCLAASYETWAWTFAETGPWSENLWLGGVIDWKLRGRDGSRNVMAQ